MTTRSTRRLVCQCGHEGSLNLRENDQPFSGLHEVYSLDGFEGESLSITNYKDMPDDLLVALAPVCPECGGSDVSFAPRTA